MLSPHALEVASGQRGKTGDGKAAAAAKQIAANGNEGRLITITLVRSTSECQRHLLTRILAHEEPPAPQENKHGPRTRVLLNFALKIPTTFTSMSKTAVIIPARWASTRFPGKPLHLLAGKPLVQHVWERACRARAIHSVIIATDDMRIANAAFEFGAEVALTSPRCISGTDRCAEVARRLGKDDFTHVINVQGDEPLISPALITQLARALSKDSELQMVTAATPFAQGEDPANPNAVKVALSQNSNALYFSRSLIPFPRDGAPFPFLRHLGIYGYSAPFLSRFVKWKTGALEAAESLEQLRALEHGVTIKVLLTEHSSIGVDTPADALAAESLLASASRLQSAPH